MMYCEIKCLEYGKNFMVDKIIMGKNAEELIIKAKKELKENNWNSITAFYKGKYLFSLSKK